MKGQPLSLRQPTDGSPARPDRDLRALRAPGQAVTPVRVGPAVFGAGGLTLAAGPCAVESGPVLRRIARAVAAAGAAVLRGGVFKPRTCPHDFLGVGLPGLELLAEARAESGLPFVTEVLDTRDVETVAECADMLQIGSRSVQNFPLLREAGLSGRPILLKRGMMTTVYEWLCAAEYVLETGNDQVVLCERGIRTFEGATRNTLDLGSVAVMKERTHLPVVVDPSHAAGDAAYVSALARAAVAVGADGLLVEVHERPEAALSDGQQSLTPDAFAALANDCRAVARALGRTP